MSNTKVKKLIPEEAYIALEGVVGAQFITTDPVQCQAYTGRGYSREQWWYANEVPRPACVAMPKNTEEVARIVKICNRYLIPWLPASAMWSIECCPRFRPDFVTIDLKRMDRLEIDEK
ncbi:MAG: FAD-binding protein, partial [Chloroflexota bacterium]